MRIFLTLFLGLFLFTTALPAAEAGMLPSGWEKPALQNGISQLPNPKGTTGIQKLRNLVVDNIAVTIRYLLISVTILFFTYNALELVLNAGENKPLETAKKNIGFSILGFATIGLASIFADAFDPARHAGTLIDVQGVWAGFRYPINYILLIVGGLATLSLAISAFKLATSHGDKDTVGKEKKNIGWALGGLVLAVSIETIITKVFYPTGKSTLGTSEIVAAAGELSGALNFFLIFVGAAAVFGFIAGGIMYVAAFGDDDGTGKAKKIMKTSLIGLVIIMVSYSFVATFAQ